MARDDDALRACLCALEMQSALSRYMTGDQPMELRIGIATGEVVAALRDVAGNRSVALTGDPMTTAARLQQLALPNEILVDEATAVGGEPRISADRIGERLLRGQSKPVTIAQLRGERRIVSHASRRAVPLVGRVAEKARIAAVISRTQATGKGGAVLLRGEPGIGKSRLLCEMEPEAKAAGLAWMWIDNAPHSMEAPYRTVRNVVDWLADEQGTKAGIVARRLLFGDLGPGDIEPETYQLMLGAIAIMARDSEMSLLPEEGWEQGLLALSDSTDFQVGLALAASLWISRMVEIRPRCIVIDDYHWVDPSSRKLVDLMITMAADMPLVVLTGSRPPATPDWVALPHVEVIDLAGLDESATEALGAAVAGSALEAESGRWLHERTAGNALFVGEIIRTLRDTGRLQQVGELCRIDPGAARRGVPLSLRALLGARIDALPQAQRSALEVAAVIGSSFTEPLLASLCGVGSGETELSDLVDAGILVREEPLPGIVEWRFRHQLYLDAAYGRLLADRRRLLHATLADLLEARDGRRDAAELARHRIAAGDTLRAVPLLEQAAREAASMGGIAEAEGFRRMLAELRGGVIVMLFLSGTLVPRYSLISSADRSST